MSNARKSHRQQAVRKRPASRKRGQQRQRTFFFSITLFTLTVMGILMGLELYDTHQPAAQAAQPVIKIMPPVQAAPTVAAVAPASSAPVEPAPWARVGIVSGHKGYDPGAVCDDGLTETQVNYAVALEVASLLRRRGIQADILDEFDDRLTDYQAEALVSIHSDSCNIPGATGFKVARVTDSAIPEAEDQLVACLNQEYATYTGLPQHPASITDGMTNYHAFSEIAPLTPGAIIEMGFLLDDRFLLESKPKILARGIAAGLLCFLEQ